MEGRTDRRPSRAAQMTGSLLVALAIVAVAIAAVTAKLGPTSVEELEAREDRAKERVEAAEERRERRQELIEKRRESGGSGPG